MSGLTKKIGTGILGGIMMALPMKKIYSQTQDSVSTKTEQTEERLWDYSFGTVSMTPHDLDFKDVFGS